MKLNIAKSILFRTPLFPVSARLEDCWEELKSAIAISSPDFYKEIEQVSKEQISSLSAKAQFTIWKYFNRSRFRATPYGRFASFGMTEIALNSASLIIAADQQEYRFSDWTAKDHLKREAVTDETFIQTNSTCYVVYGSIRYIGATDKGFELMGYEKSGQVDFLLELCRYGIQVKAVLADTDAQDLGITLPLIEELIREELLLSNHEPNIIGPDFFFGKDVGSYNTTEYMIAERSAIAGGLASTQVKHMPELLSLLASLVPVPESRDLENFKSSFQRRFEERMVPIMVALDPETGIDYGGLSGTGTSDIAAEFIKQELQEEKGEVIKKHLRQQLIAGNHQKTVDLEEIFSTVENKDVNFPNTMNVLVSINGSQVCLEQAGGCTATSLLGRFTLASEEVHSFCKELATLEQEANPSMLFFDIGYMAEGYVDNINRRKDIYEYQLAILNYNTAAEPLSLSDIYMGIRRGRLVLWSAKHRKRLIPRLASAYNFSRSDLPLFRLLCDLQFEGIHPRPFFKVEQIFPYIKTFPRIQYRNIVVSKAKWRLTKKEISTLRSSVRSGRELLEDRNVSAYFSAGPADQKLVFNLGSDEDLDALRQYTAQQEEIILEEWMEMDHPYVNDNKGRGYHVEFILSMVHQRACYQGLEIPVLHLTQTNGNYEPGSQWLYAEIFCHPTRADSILLERLIPLINEQRHLLEHWFFIRYNEGGNHIRFRIKMKSAQSYGTLLAELRSSLSQELADGIVADLALKTYKPEYERYGHERMRQVELHFYKDSEFVVSLIEDRPETFQLYQLCTGTIHYLIAEKIFTEEEVKEMVGVVSGSFNKEHSLDTKDYKKLNNIFRDYRQVAQIVLNPNQQQLFKWFKKSFAGVLETASKQEQAKLFSDLMHMHVNRLFAERQRTHEMIWYYLLEKDLRRTHALRRADPVVS